MPLVRVVTGTRTAFWGLLVVFLFPLSLKYFDVSNVVEKSLFVVAVFPVVRVDIGTLGFALGLVGGRLPLFFLKFLVWDVVVKYFFVVVLSVAEKELGRNCKMNVNHNGVTKWIVKTKENSTILPLVRGATGILDGFLLFSKYFDVSNVVEK